MSRIARWSLALAVALIALCASFGSVAAAPRPANTPPPDNAQLERAYKIERQRLREMGYHFQQAGAYASEVAGLVAHLKQHGVDTSALDQALATFRDRMAEAHGQWAAARDVLAAHAGFDDRGHVTDAGQARVTVARAHASLLRARAIGETAFRDLRAAVAAFRQAQH